MPVIWILGGPGSGKGTQCDRIVAKYKFSHFSTGDLLRDEVKSGSEKGKQLSEMMARGDLVPNDEVLGLLKNAMAKVADSTVGYLIDGYPREKSQGAAFEKQIAPVDIILYFECAEVRIYFRSLLALISLNCLFLCCCRRQWFPESCTGQPRVQSNGPTTTRRPSKIEFTPSVQTPRKSCRNMAIKSKG